jgi:hypothetical protein
MLLLVLVQMQTQTQCAPRIDTVRDTIYAVLTPARTADPITAAALTPVVRALAAQANSHGNQIMSLGAGPAGPIIDLNPTPAPHGLPPMLAQLPPGARFTLHRDGTLTHAPDALVGLSATYPDGVTGDSLALNLAFAITRDSTHASAPFYVRRIYLLPIKQQARPLPTNPQAIGKMRDTALVQFAVTADGTVDTSTFYPIRARSQASIEAVRAILPALHFTSALAQNDCPARTVLSQRIVIRPQ